MYNSCSGISDPILSSPEASDNLSESDDDAVGVTGKYLA